MIALQRWISSTVILSLLIVVTDVPALAGGGGDVVVRVSNQEVRVEGDVAIISYELDVPQGESYIITLVLLRESDPAFKAVPSNATGDVGEVKAGSAKRMIRWDFRKDFPAGLRGEDFYFRIDVSRSGGGIPWLWVGLGIAAAGVAVAVLKGKPDATPAAQSQSLPYPPPGR